MIEFSYDIIDTVYSIGMNAMMKPLKLLWACTTLHMNAVIHAHFPLKLKELHISCKNYVQVHKLYENNSEFYAQQHIQISWSML